MIRFKFPQAGLEEVLLKLSEKPGQIAMCKAGVNRRKEIGFTELLFHRAVDYTRKPEFFDSDAKGIYPLLVAMSNSPEDARKSGLIEWVDRYRNATGLVFIVNGNDMQAFYVLPSSSKNREPVVLSIPGPGMEQMVISDLRRGDSNKSDQDSATDQDESEINDILFW